MPPEVAHDENQRPSGSAFRERVDRLRRRLRQVIDWAGVHRLQATLLLAASLASVLGFIVMGMVLRAMDRSEQVTSLDAALRALDQGQYKEARQMAQELRGQPKPSLSTLAGTALVLGAVVAAEAEQETYVPDRKHQYLVAVGYLDEARDLGFPPDREPDGLFLLGKSLYESGQYPQSRPVLREALAQNPQKTSEIHPLLTGAYLYDATPDHAKALEHNTLFLADRMLLPRQRHQGLLDRARILLQKGQTAGAQNAIAEIPEGAIHRAEVMIFRARLLMREAATLAQTEIDQVDAIEKYQAAIQVLQAAQSHDTLGAGISGQAMYLIGVCYLELDEDRTAGEQLARTSRTFPGTPEAMAADFRLARLARKLGRDPESLAAYQRVLGSIADPGALDNRWVSMEQIRTEVIDAYHAYLDADKFELAVELAKSLHPTFSTTRALELVGGAYRSSGTNRLAMAAHLPPSEGEPLARQAREQLRRAGRVYEHLARARIATRKYPDDLWDSAQSYFAGASFSTAIKMFEKYLANESQKRRPRVLLRLGEARLALGDIDAAIESLEECIGSYPRDPAAFRARMVAANAHVEKSDFSEARRLLEENLAGDWLAPASAEWQESLFALGQLLHAEGRYEEATVRLEEVVKWNEQRKQEAADRREEVVDDFEVSQVHYLAGHSYLAIVKQAKQKLLADTVPNVRVARNAKIQDHLKNALNHFQKTQKALLERQKNAELPPLEQSMLRNASFSIGGALFDQERYEESLKEYETIVNNYQESPEVLDAYVQMAHAYRRLNRPDDALMTLEQAKAALEQFPDESTFAATSIFGKQQWAELLDRLETL